MDQKITEKAGRCLNCPTKPCSKEGCPINTRIPEFIDAIKRENLDEAYNILIENNICSHICSEICPQEWQCEGKCVRGINGDAVSIGELEKFVNQWAEENNIEYNFPIKEKKDKKIAIVGSGPAGIECAYELLKKGFDVTIFEKEHVLGGVLNYGIPNFRLDKKLIENIFAKLKNMGCKIQKNVELGKDIGIEYLKENFDASFLAIGAGKSRSYKLSENEIAGIYDSSEILKIYNSNGKIDNLGNVIVIGGGNVAMDSARATKRMGAKSVKIVYRRDKEHMPAMKSELDDALKDGIEFVTLTRVISASNQNEKVASINCIKTEIVDDKAKDIPNTEFEIEADTVVFAIGQKIDKNLIEKCGINVSESGLVEVDENYMTNIKNIFAGGDLVLTKQTVCQALKTGKKVAENIDLLVKK